MGANDPPSAAPHPVIPMVEFILTPHHLQSCFQINFNGSVGTAFLYGSTKRTFFVTAAHILRGARPGDNVLIRRGEGSVPVPLSKIFWHPQDYDVCIFVSDKFHADIPPPVEEDFQLLPGAQLKFLGFPHGLNNTYPGQNGFGTPLVRNAYFSGTLPIKGLDTIILDGFNNPGYSGGPVYARTFTGKPILMGVISGYRIEERSKSRIYRQREDGTEEELPDLYTKPNSGMIHAVPWAYLASLISKIDQFNGD